MILYSKLAKYAYGFLWFMKCLIFLSWSLWQFYRSSLLHNLKKKTAVQTIHFNEPKIDVRKGKFIGF